MTTIGLCMIVKNESKVITRCLDSVRPLVDYVMIEDTGSTDGTQQLITEWLERAAMPGMVIEEPWRDFAYNRSHVLVKLRELEQIDYALIIDADDLLVLPKDFDPTAFKAGMRDDLYDVQIRHGGSRFYRPQICANKLPFCFKAVLHEYLEAPAGPLSRSTAEGFYIETGRGGARNENPAKYQDDAAMLAKALLTETEPFLISRYTFYVAQSYRDCGEREKALVYYLKRAELGYWAEEIFESLYEAAKLQEVLGFSVEEVIATYLRATDAAPTRAEALHGAARFCRFKGRNEEGYQYAKRGCDIPVPAGGLFVESWVYAYGLLDELAINGYWSGHHREALDACLRLLASSALPVDQRGRVAQNARFSLEKLPGDRDRDLGSLGQSNLADQHPLVAERPLRSRIFGTPRVMVAILAKQKERMLPLYLDCIEALDYPKSSIVLYVRTNNNTDGTERILRQWVERVGHLYAAIEFVADDVPEPVQQFGAHEWNAVRFRVLGRIRNISLGRAVEHKCDFYFVADVDNFVRSCTLRELLALNLPIVSPLLRSIEAGQFYSNYHAEVDANGYYRNCDQYQWILNRWVRGVIEVPVVHTTYLIRADMIPALNYEDATTRHEYVVFSDSARQAGAVQYLDNRQVYGYIAFGEDSPQYVVGGVERARSLLSGDLGGQGGSNSIAAIPSTGAQNVPGVGKDVIRGKPRVFGCFGQHGSGSTWMFNLVREICLAEGVDFVSVHRDSKANLPWDAPGSPLIVAKSHNPMADFQSYIVDSGEPAVITVRDPRDAVVSFMQRFPNSSATDFEEALKAIAWSAERLVALSRLRKLPLFRYEDKFIGSVETFDRIAAMLHIIPSETHRTEILAALEPEAVKEKINCLEAAGSICGEAIWDRETHWHANHVGDGRVGKFRENLSVAQENQVLQRTREYCGHFGYDITASSRGILNAELAGGQVAESCGASSSGLQPTDSHSGPERDEEAHIRESFSKIYQRNEWGYGSGVGSLASNNTSYMEFVQTFIKSHSIKSIVDFGCGDWQFSRLMNWSGADYIGLDLVPDLIETNRKNFVRSGVSFEVFKSLDDVPNADLLLCKDVFQHLSNDTIAKYLAIFKQRFRILLITNDDQPDTLVNGEIEAGGWRPIRLDRPPFAERAPIVLSWTVTEGGWIPTHKAACLINGNSGGVVLRSTVEFATSGDNHAWPAARDRDSNRVSGGVQPATLVDGAAHSTRVMNPRTHIGGWATESGCDAIGHPLASDPASGDVAAFAASDGYSLVTMADPIRVFTSCETIPFPEEASLGLRRQLDERPAEAGDQVSGLGDSSDPMVSGPEGKRFIRLKEFRPCSTIIETPSDFYIAARDSSLIRRPYKITTNQDGFILPRSGGRPHGRKIVVIGDSVVESMYVEPDHRFCSRLEDILCDELGLEITVLNGGYGGTTMLHSLNVFLNKLIPLRPAAVILMTGIVDVDVAYLKASYWSHDCWVEPIVDATATNTWRDSERLPCPSFDDRTKMLTMFATAGRLFNIPMGYATVPHRQVFSGEYVQKAFGDKADFDRQVDARKQMNDVTRRAAVSAGIPLFDLEHELGARSDIFHDMFHLNSLGGEAVARAFVRCGIDELLKSKAPADATIQHLPAVVGDFQRSAIRGVAPAGETLASLEQIHLINLDRSTDRLANFINCNSHLDNILRISAVDGARVNRRELVRDGTITEDLSYTPSALGCALSHVGLWKKASSEDRVVTILEDDTICSLNFHEESVRIALSLPVDWDIIQWGYIFDPLFLWLDFGFSKANLRFYDTRVFADYRGFRDGNVSSSAVRLVHSFGTQAYSVSPKGARALLKSCLPLRKRRIPFPGTSIVNDDLGIDTAMCAAYGSMQAFICIPPLVAQDERQASTIGPRDRGSCKL